MSLRMDLIWQDDDVIEYRANCAGCSYRSMPFAEEETAAAAWLGHLCVRVGSLPSA
jgi:hypothetical protein